MIIHRLLLNLDARKFWQHRYRQTNANIPKKMTVQWIMKTTTLDCSLLFHAKLLVFSAIQLRPEYVWLLNEGARLYSKLLLRKYSVLAITMRENASDVSGIRCAAQPRTAFFLQLFRVMTMKRLVGLTATAIRIKRMFRDKAENHDKHNPETRQEVLTKVFLQSIQSCILTHTLIDSG